MKDCGPTRDVLRELGVFTASSATLPNQLSDVNDSDSVSARTLSFGVNIPSGTTAESCTAACQAAGGFTNAGLENGHECCKGASFSIYFTDH